MIPDQVEARKQWNAMPCGTGGDLAALEYGSLAWFDAIRRSRYEVTDRWIRRVIDFNMTRGKKLLEIGHGVGSDLLTFCEAGAEVYGIDIAEEHHRLANRNFELHGRPCILELGDCAAIGFPDGFFDYVYSLGVLHHTSHTVRCISEAYRVLKRGGQLILAVYRRYAAFHLFQKLLYEGIVQGKLRTLGYRGLMATVERGADGIHTRPLVKTFVKGQLQYMLADFSRVEFKVAHFKREHIPGLGRLLPARLEPVLEPCLGWYLVAFATK